MTEVYKPGGHGKVGCVLLFFQLELEQFVIHALPIF